MPMRSNRLQLKLLQDRAFDDKQMIYSHKKKNASDNKPPATRIPATPAGMQTQRQQDINQPERTDSNRNL
jgi:hypothetical protein